MLLPPFKGLLAFDAIARLGSISKAAEELNLTVSAVSHQAANLAEVARSGEPPRHDHKHALSHPLHFFEEERVRDRVRVEALLPFARGQTGDDQPDPV